MSGSGISRRVVPGAALLLVAVGVLASSPAQADPTSYSSWVTREDAMDGTSTTHSLPGPDAQLRLGGTVNGVSIDQGNDSGLEVHFEPPEHQTLQEGATFQARGGDGRPDTQFGDLYVRNPDTMCSVPNPQPNDLEGHSFLSQGSFHVDQLEVDGSGTVTKFAATFVMNCWTLGADSGFEGSVAVNAAEPSAALPDAPVTPGPVTNLKATNIAVRGGGYSNSTTLTWDNPANFSDILVRVIYLYDDVPVTAGGSSLGNASSWQPGGTVAEDALIDSEDTRTYRLVARGPTGRLGPTSTLTVQGTRLSIPGSHSITIGQDVEVAGRASLSWAYHEPDDVMKGPGLVGRTLDLCRQTDNRNVDEPCTLVDRTTSTTDGRFTLSDSPTQNTSYSVRLHPSPQNLGNAAWLVIALVAPQTDLRAREGQQARARVKSIRRGSVIHFTTSRARAGSRGVVRLQRYDGHTWRSLRTKHLGKARHGARRLAIPYRERHRGVHLYRIVKLADSHHVNGYSHKVRVRVR